VRCAPLPVGWAKNHRNASRDRALRREKSTLSGFQRPRAAFFTGLLALSSRLKDLPPIDALAHPNNGDKFAKHAPLLDAATASEATAQDSAAAFIIICDYSLQRLAAEGMTADTRTIGPEAYNGVKLNQAIWALANQARHLHQWQQNNWDPESYAVLLALEVFPTYHDAARLFLEKLNLPAYVEFEDRLTSTARDVLAGTGFELTATGPGIVSISIVSRNADAPGDRDTVDGQ